LRFLARDASADRPERAGTSGTCRSGLRRSLRRQRDAYVAMSADEPDPKDLSTMASAWRTGDAAQRWEVLNALFERIHVRQDRKVEGYTPRMDRANRVRLMIGTAFDYVYGWSAVRLRVRAPQRD
jgi:hypothetical protein